MQRLSWCLENENNDFANYLFVDETTIRIEELPLYQIRERGIPEAQTRAIDKERLKINIWGGISNCGVTQFVGFEQNMNGPIYCDILEKFVLPFTYSANDGYIIIHQDNASTHTGEPAKSFLPQLGLIWVHINLFGIF
jgi:hypothetical protein